MKIPVKLNGQKIVFDALPDESLMDVLHRYSCVSVKTGCREGSCGACAVLVDDKTIPSCKIPVGLVKDSEIVTLEYFSKGPEYSLIMSGFNKAGIKLCGYCNAGKIFTAYQILKLQKIPTREEIAETARELAPCCTDLETLVNGIVYAIQFQNKRIQRIT